MSLDRARRVVIEPLCEHDALERDARGNASSSSTTSWGRTLWTWAIDRARSSVGLRRRLRSSAIWVSPAPEGEPIPTTVIRCRSKNKLSFSGSTSLARRLSDPDRPPAVCASKWRRVTDRLRRQIAGVRGGQARTPIMSGNGTQAPGHVGFGCGITCFCEVRGRVWFG